MTSTLIVLDSGLSDELRTRLGMAVDALYSAFLDDTRSLAATVGPARTVSGTRPLARTLASSLSKGPTVLIGGDLPHLPPYRIKDAFTYLDTGADLVIGPADSGDWYLIGMRVALPGLLEVVPAYGDTIETLISVARHMELHLKILPAWYTIRRLTDLGRLTDDLRPMPADVAPQTRALFDDNLAQSRAVGG